MTEDARRNRRRSEEDEDRDRKVYQYLLHLSGIKEGTNEEIDEAEIAKRWGQESNRPFIHRVIKEIYPTRIKQERGKKDEPLPALSLNRLVKILKAIEAYWQNKSRESYEIDIIPEFLEPVNKIRALYKYSELSRKEKEALNLPTDFKTYIQENIISKNHNNPRMKTKEEIFQADRIIDDTRLEQFLKEVIKNKLFQDKEDTKKVKLQEKIREIKDKVKSEIKAIELQSGLQSAKATRLVVPDNCHEVFDEYLSQKWIENLPESWIIELVNITIDNIKLQERFPIYFKYIEVNQVGPLPLEKDSGLLNEKLTELFEEKDEISGLISALGQRYTYRVKVHFSVKTDEGKEISFCGDISGTSSILSLIRRALNRVLLWDLPVLKEYFPIAQDVNPEDRLCGGGDTTSTVWSTSKVRIVKLDDLEKLLKIKEIRQKNCPLLKLVN